MNGVGIHNFHAAKNRIIGFSPQCKIVEARDFTFVLVKPAAAKCLHVIGTQ